MASRDIPAELAAKIQRAQEHINTLLVENTDEYFQSSPYSIAIEPADAEGLIGHDHPPLDPQAHRALGITPRGLCIRNCEPFCEFFFNCTA